MALGLSVQGGLFQNPLVGGENESHGREIRRPIEELAMPSPMVEYLARTIKSGADPLHATG
ncbi:hypothetical protein TIFTF001_004230 [Ficus carica]|uniref:Uncharacterized protein n=1 Tax=Ficus carica TaxID=3494 RepID=A0AA87ZAW7_FICCA|nr:hypothetical protein TIFTF001_004230 [Ficus carica]